MARFLASLAARSASLARVEGARGGAIAPLCGYVAPGAFSAPVLAKQPANAFASSSASAGGSQQLDWGLLQEHLHSDEAKRELGALRKTYFDMLERTKATSKTVPLDFAEWRKKLDPEIVKQFEDAYKSFEAVSYSGSEVDATASLLGEIRTKAMAQSESARAAILDIEQRIRDIDQAKERLKTASVDDELEKQPQLRDKIDKEIEQGNW